MRVHPVRSLLFLALAVVGFELALPGCSTSPTALESNAIDAGTLPLAGADSTAPQALTKPQAQPFATPQSFPGWSVVNATSIEEFGPWYDRDYKITFYIPGRSSLPSSRSVAALNRAGTWLLYDNYVLFYSHGTAGSYYRVTYVYGKGKNLFFNIDMKPGNWALYYR